MKSVFVKSQNANTQAFHGLVYNGVIEISVKMENLMKLPVKNQSALKLGAPSKAKPFKL